MSLADPQGAIAPWVKKLDKIMSSLVKVAEKESNDDEKRLAAAKLLCRVPQYKTSGVELLSRLLRPQVDESLQSAAIETIAQSGLETVPKVLENAWPELSPDLRNIAVDAWLSRESWTNQLLKLIEKRTLAASGISLTQRARLLQHPTPSIARRAKRVFETSGSSTRKDVVKRYQNSLELPADASQGQAIYARACANCHRRGGSGNDVGPDLATVINHPKEKLLTNILDPNADIQPGYQAYSCLLESGEILTGLVASETTNSVTIKQANSTSRSIARREIERLQSSNLSFMPEGLEATISEQEMADLLAFLQQPIQADAGR
jgi:putative heme-binding domain-containing protein